MYLDYFGLNDFPFRITPDTDYLYMSKAHARAKAYMEYAIFNREGFVVITGEIGCGKTTLIQQLLKELDEHIVVAKIFQTQLDEVELLQAILVEFGLNPFSAKKVELLNMMNHFLIDSYLSGKQVLLIIDDAQNLSKRVLEEVTMLSGVETQKEKILHVILVGQPELNHKLECDDMEQLLQRVSLRYHVKPLSEREIKQYIRHRLGVAGREKKLFSDDIYQKIYLYTGGVPRLINTICDTALTCAFADSKEYVDEEDFDNAIQELQWKTYAENHMKTKESWHHENALCEHNDFRREESGNSDSKEIVHATYSPIASRALVELVRQLKRIADCLDQNIKK